MKANPKVGTTGEERFVVEPRHAIDFADGKTMYFHKKGEEGHFIYCVTR